MPWHRVSLLFIILLAFSFFPLSSPLVACPELLNASKTDPLGDTNNAFVDIVNATVFRNDTVYSFSVFTAEEVPTDFSLLYDFPLQSISYSVRFLLWMNETIHYISVIWDNQSWVADARYFQEEDPQGWQVWDVLVVDHINTQLSFTVPVSFLGNSSPLEEWYTYCDYHISYTRGYEDDFDICPDGGVSWYGSHLDLKQTIVTYEIPQTPFWDQPILGLPLLAWLIIIPGLILIIYIIFKEGIIF